MMRSVDSNRAHIPDMLLTADATGAGFRWHKTSTLSDGTPIGRLGAYWYVLDEQGRAISDGYHEISLDENGRYKGKRSARSELITLYTDSERA